MLQISSSKTLQTCALVEKINICMKETHALCFQVGSRSFFVDMLLLLETEAVSLDMKIFSLLV